MKTYSKLLIAAGALAAMSSCAKHDLIPETVEVGQPVPAVYWEVGSTVCKAGENFTFQGKYTVEPNYTPVRAEVWYNVLRSDAATVTTKLAGTSLSYSQTASSQEEMRSNQCNAVYAHNDEYWNGHEFIFQGEVATSRTLSPVTWVDATEWDQERFDSYYPQGFVEEYLTKVLDYLTNPSTANSYYNALRTVYLNYAFTNEQFAAVGLPQLDLSGDDNGTSVKSDAWFSTTEASDAALVGQYYITLDADGNAVYNEVAKDYEPAEGQVLYPVYKSSEWVFCRYDDNSGSIISTVRPEWLPKFRTLLEDIPFQDWIYDSANGVYKVDFARNYSLEAEFHAVAKETSQLNDANAPEYVGVTATTLKKTITIN
ncbi:MAG: hypothetical protein K2M55_09545 [Muribaculaceae bacterium]|nr:hypothetical protein [Muribaculaceae bacterium]